MASSRRLRRLPLLLSLALHGGLVLLAVRFGQAPEATRVAVEAIELELIDPPAAVVEAPAEVSRPVAEQAPAAAKPKRKRTPKPVQHAAPDAVLDESATARPEAPAPNDEAKVAGPLRPAMPGAPLAASPPSEGAATGTLVLTPSARVAERHGVGSLTGPGAGLTLRPGDPSPPSEFLLAREGRTVEGRIEGMLLDVLAHDRVDKGLVDDYFAELKQAFEKSASEPPKTDEVGGPVTALVHSYLGGMERYGATGNPYAEPTGPRHSDPGSPGARRTDDALSNPVQAMNRFQDFIEGRFARGIVAIVEVKQAKDGKFLDAQLLRSSGTADFDQHALKAVPDAITTLPPPRGGGGIHDHGIHSVWAFEGRLVYAQPVEGAADALYLVFGGSFDETTGTLHVNKLDKPKFVCKVRLLKVY